MTTKPPWTDHPKIKSKNVEVAGRVFFPLPDLYRKIESLDSACRVSNSAEKTPNFGPKCRSLRSLNF